MVLLPMLRLLRIFLLLRRSLASVSTEKIAGSILTIVVVMIVGIGLIGTVSATVAAWFVTRPGEPVTEPATLLDR
jgi:hypothetical protein